LTAFHKIPHYVFRVIPFSWSHTDACGQTDRRTVRETDLREGFNRLFPPQCESA